MKSKYLLLLYRTDFAISQGVENWCREVHSKDLETNFRQRDLGRFGWERRRRALEYFITWNIVFVKATIILKSSKMQSNVWHFFFLIEALLSLKNVWLPPIFFLDTKSTCQVLLSPHSFKLLKNIPVLVGTTHRKPEYLMMRKTYAQ